MDHQLVFEGSNGQVHITATDGDVILIAGPNGVGKSALLASLYRSIPQGEASYLPGHRQINFNSGGDALAQSLLDLKNNLFQHIDHFSRYKNSWAEDQFRSIIRMLSNAEAAYNRSYRKAVEEGQVDARERASIRISPIDTLNLIFEAARLAVRFEMTAIGIAAKRGTAEYRIDTLSDGERAALFIAGAIITQDKETVLLIDEPEKHLHPSISGPLIQAALRSRDDICVIMASHDVSIIERAGYAKLIHIVDSTVITELPETRSFKAAIINQNDDIPESLRRDILGSRSDVLFIEGEQSSYDLALYGHIYPGTKITPKGGFFKVVESVKALRSLQTEHWIVPFGLIDGDGRNAEERSGLEDAGIFSLPYPTIENLFFLEEALRCFVEADLSHSAGPTLEVRLKALASSIPDFAKKARDDIVAKRSSWAIERALNGRKLGSREIKDGFRGDIVISVSDIVNRVEIIVDEILSTGDWKTILQTMPIKSTKIPNLAAKTLEAVSFDTYRRIIIRQIDIKTPSSILLLQKLREVLPRIGSNIGIVGGNRAPAQNNNVIKFPQSNS